MPQTWVSAGYFRQSAKIRSDVLNKYNWGVQFAIERPAGHSDLMHVNVIIAVDVDFFVYDPRQNVSEGPY